MSWMAKLYQTYSFAETQELERPWPNAHLKKNAHVEVVIDGNGTFLRVNILGGQNASTLIPVTEKSGARTGNIEAHPLCEELSYCAFDLHDGVKKKDERNNSYRELLTQWCNSDYSHPKVRSVKTYIDQSRLWSDISGHINFPLVFKTKSVQKITPEKCFVRWRVEVPGNPISGTWEDDSLIKSWINFEKFLSPKNGFCYVTGKESRLAKFHPKFVRNAADGARFITQNDWDGFTFLGRFTDSKRAVTEKNEVSQVSEVSFEVTQKAHNALRWLISRQGYQGCRNGDQVVVAWAVSGRDIPPLLNETSAWDLDDFGDDTETAEEAAPRLEVHQDLTRDIGQLFGRALKSYMQGYFNGKVSHLKESESIVVMALDSATPGRMAITYYRDYMAKDYVQTIESWHWQFAWYQRVRKEVEDGAKRPRNMTRWLISAPSPKDIFRAAYGDIDDKKKSHKRSTYERLIPCLVEGRQLPVDLLHRAIERAGNRSIKRLSDEYSNPSSEEIAWERDIGVTCALYRGFFNRHPDLNKRRDHPMSLDTEYKSRDYLYGRLLAVAERIEEIAMYLASEPARSTHASRLMQRFADRPASTWLTIEKSLVPYQQRLRTRLAPLEGAYKRLLDDICDAFTASDFNSESRLSGEYLLGFHCQRKWLRDHKLEKGQWVKKLVEDIDSIIQEGEEQ